MDAKTQRKHLNDYTQAARNIELNEAAIKLLGDLITMEAASAIKVLKRGQQRQLKLLDAAAAKLGAPYGA
jgi:hypothetical protein